MKQSMRTSLLILLLFALCGLTVGYYVWNKPKREVENEKGIEVTSSQLVQEFQASEAEANKKYLDKAIQVTGPVTEVKNNQEGKQTILLSSNDDFTGVFCTLKESAATIVPGSVVTIKGLCSGMLSDVRLRDAVVVK